MNKVLRAAKFYYANESVYLSTSLKMIDTFKFEDLFKFMTVVIQHSKKADLINNIEDITRSFDVIIIKLEHSNIYEEINDEKKKILREIFSVALNIGEILKSADKLKAKLSCEWIHYLIQCGLELDYNLINLMNVIGCYEMVDMYMQMEDVPQNVFACLFKNYDIYRNVLLNVESIKNIMEKHKLMFDEECFVNAISSYIYTDSIHHKKNILTCMEKIGWKIDIESLAIFLKIIYSKLLPYSYVDKTKDEFTKYFYNTIYGANVSFYDIFTRFLKKNQLPADIIYIMEKLNNMPIEKISTADLISILDTIFVSFETISQFNSLTVNKVLNKFTYDITQELFDYAIRYNISYIYTKCIEQLNKNLNLTYDHLLMATKNDNIALIKYLLEHKISPKKGIFLDIITSIPYLVHIKNIADLFKLYGYMISEKEIAMIYIVGMECPYDVSEKVIKHMNTGGKSKYIGDPHDFNKIEEYLFATGNVHSIRKYTTQPTPMQLKLSLFNSSWHVHEYIQEQYKYTPSIATIMTIEHRRLRFALLYKFYPELCENEFL